MSIPTRQNRDTANPQLLLKTQERVMTNASSFQKAAIDWQKEHFQNDGCKFRGAEAKKLPLLTMLKGLLTAWCLEGLALPELTSRLNDYCCQLKQTVSLMLLQLQENNVAFLACGYGHLWQQAKEGAMPVLIPSSHPVLGVEEDVAFEVTTVLCHAGDRLFLLPVQEEVLPAAQVEQHLQAYRQRSLQETVEGLLRKVKTTTPQFLETHPFCCIGILEGQT